MGELYRYQQDAVDKFMKVWSSLAGMDMGTGKTVVAVELDRRRRLIRLPEKQAALFAGKRKMTLVSCPLSVMSSWEDHFKEWNPSLKVMVLDVKDRKSFTDAVLAGTHDVYICHWKALRFMPELARVMWFHKIGDECQYAKNPKAQLTQQWWRIKSLFKHDQSGTWADNKPDDAYGTLHHLYPKTWTSYTRFVKNHVVIKNHPGPDEFCMDCEKRHQRPYRETVGVKNEDFLHANMEKFYVRVTKEEALPDLPEKYWTQIDVDLTPQQRKAYDQMRRNMLAWVGEHEDQPIAAPIAIAKLVRLLQFTGAYGEIVKVKKPWSTEHRELYERKYGKKPERPWDMVDALKLTEPSSKLDALQDLIESTRDPLIVFSQSKQIINMLGRRLEKEGMPHGLLTGDVSQSARGQVVHDFQSGKLRVFAGTISAGGVGITLTRGSTVVFIDRAWSPAVNLQAEDRAHRIGQKNAVQIINLVARNTIDGERLDRIDLKWSELKKILGG